MSRPILRRAALPLLALLVLAAPASAQSYTATLRGSTPASGSVSATLTGTTLVVTGTFDGLVGTYVEAHIHAGPAGEYGPILFSLAPTVDAGARGGSFAAAANTFTLTPEQATALQVGSLNADVHSSFYSYEIRGQFYATVSTARAFTPLTTVAVEGSVTRALGRYAWIQDETAGIAVFGTTGSPFALALANGSVRVGDRIQVTGRLIEFQPVAGTPGSGLTEIDNILYDAFQVLSRGNALPATQTVTLAQFTAGDPVDTDDYESEIVRVENLTIDPMGDVVFSAGRTYPVSQTIDAVTTVSILRIGSPGDSDLIGTPIPTGLVTFEGPGGQFRGVNQLTAVRTTDLTAGGTATAETPAGRLSLDVANPLRGSALVRFSTEAAQDVRLAVYDVLGREVAVLAQGVASGAQSATLNTSGFAPGVYVLRLTAGAGSVTQAVTVVR